MLYIFIFSHKFIPYVELILNSAKVTNDASEKYIEDMRFFSHIHSLLLVMLY
ncbi:hypothetical protein VCHA28O22_10836 [Vibrio chagasii]|nr:hypothetical protein VCHA28O22_10836 [Vibrio chagasii]CAH7154343.1 hypothetical protein VCHA53O474_10839 [Vibrio chagasii]CAH7281417.1 hypothetical protein VCHA50O393_40080 [Vibrio chagasii]CAH7409156.1 hypothetical protein VCHA40P238_70219 [Vibrio chagasii]